MAWDTRDRWGGEYWVPCKEVRDTPGAPQLRDSPSRDVARCPPDASGSAACSGSPKAVVWGPPAISGPEPVAQNNAAPARSEPMARCAAGREPRLPADTQARQPPRPMPRGSSFPPCISRSFFFVPRIAPAIKTHRQSPDVNKSRQSPLLSLLLEIVSNWSSSWALLSRFSKSFTTAAFPVAFGAWFQSVTPR